MSLNKLILLFFTISFFACNYEGDRRTKQIQNNDEQIKDTSKEITLNTRYKAFDTTVEVLFQDTKDSISSCQKENYEGFITRQDSLTPEIMRRIFEFYKKSYESHREETKSESNISDSDLNQILPIINKPEDLKKFITPAIIHIQSSKKCEEGTFGIEFDCPWDIENGLGVLIKNWKVADVSVAEITYF